MTPPIKVGTPGYDGFVDVMVYLRAVDFQRYNELCVALKEMEAHYADRSLNAPDDNSTFTAKGFARGIREIRRLVTDASRIAEETAPKR